MVIGLAYVRIVRNLQTTQITIIAARNGRIGIDQMRNLDIRIMVSELGLRYIDIAKRMGISRVWLSNLMRYDLTPENRSKILEAIRGLKRYHVGDKVYFAGYDDNFPDQSEVDEYEVTDASEKGLIFLEEDGLWIDPSDPREHMYPTREQAEEALKKLIVEGRNDRQMED
jgi:transcriptional regulator with XRE-family HTH domain